MCIRDSSDTVKYLISKNADVNAVDEQGRTALMEAVNAYKLDEIKDLVDNGADINKADNKAVSYTHLDVYKRQLL